MDPPQAMRDDALKNKWRQKDTPLRTLSVKVHKEKEWCQLDDEYDRHLCKWRAEPKTFKRKSKETHEETASREPRECLRGA